MINTFRRQIEKKISKMKLGSEPQSLYEPIRYLMQLGGKRLRPLLVVLAYSLYKKDISKIWRYAIAVEIFHNFTLMHDDIMDQASLRRGKATVNAKWNTNTAILSGDSMLIKAYEQFLSLEGNLLKPVLKTFTQCAAEVCEGQQLDMLFETLNEVSETEYLEMIRLKTAVLLGFSLELGALLAGAPKQDQVALRQFGVNIGIGFQLKDDLLDVYANQHIFGKQVGGDIFSNKKTFLLIKALEKAKGEQKKELVQWLSASSFKASQKIDAITAIYNDLEIPQLTEVKINQYFEKGFRQLSRIKNVDTSHIRSFAQQLIARQQ